jgi:hypothetical protein
VSVCQVKHVGVLSAHLVGGIRTLVPAKISVFTRMNVRMEKLGNQILVDANALINSLVD